MKKKEECCGGGSPRRIPSLGAAQPEGQKDKEDEILKYKFTEFVQKSIVKKDSIDYICSDDIDFFTDEKSKLLVSNLKRVLKTYKDKVDFAKLLTEEEIKKHQQIEANV